MPTCFAKDFPMPSVAPVTTTKNTLYAYILVKHLNNK